MKITLTTNHPKYAPRKRERTGELNRTRYAVVGDRFFCVFGASGSWQIEEIAPDWIDNPMLDPKVGNEYVGFARRLSDAAGIIEQYLVEWPTESSDDHYARLRRFAQEIIDRRNREGW